MIRDVLEREQIASCGCCQRDAGHLLCLWFSYTTQATSDMVNNALNQRAIHHVVCVHPSILLFLEPM